MANGHGGQRTPSSPAPVSGPGALSQRTDGSAANPKGQPVRTPTGGGYGDATQLKQAEQGAPMAQSAGGDQVSPGLLAGLSIPTGPGFGEPTQQPDVPVTAGAASGPGPGPEALGLPVQQDADMQMLQRYLPVLESMADQPGAPAAARNYVRAIKATVGS